MEVPVNPDQGKEKTEEGGGGGGEIIDESKEVKSVAQKRKYLLENPDIHNVMRKRIKKFDKPILCLGLEDRRERIAVEDVEIQFTEFMTNVCYDLMAYGQRYQCERVTALIDALKQAKSIAVDVILLAD
jgi:hypothetical protein